MIAQLVARTWTVDGWMYTAAQLQSAVEVAHQMRAARIAAEQSPVRLFHDPTGEADRNRWACRTDLKRFIARSRCRVG